MGKYRYTPEHLQFIAERCGDHSIVQLTEMFNRRFEDMHQTYAAMKTMMARNRLYSGYRTRGPGTPTKLWSEEAIEYIKSPEYSTRTLDQNLEELNRRTGREYTRQQLAARAKRLKACTSFDGRFGPAHQSMYHAPKGAHLSTGTEFRKGHRPMNALPVGTEVVDSYGYKKRKVAEPREWRYVHHLVWEEHNGPVPKGCRVIFLNGDRMDTDIENLAAIPHSINCVMAKNRFFTNDRELTKTNILVARVMCARVKRRKGTDGQG